VFPSIDTLPTTHPHSMLISQIIDDQKKKTENLPQFEAILDDAPISKRWHIILEIMIVNNGFCFPEKSKFVKKVEEMKKKEEEISVKVASVLKRNIETVSTNPTQGLSTPIDIFQ
jgi:hypothetical protein